VQEAEPSRQPPGGDVPPTVRELTCSYLEASLALVCPDFRGVGILS
jgi:hypothetical protein